MVAYSLDDVTPQIQSALLLLALPVLRRWDLLRSDLRPGDVCQKLGVSRSTAYALSGPVLEAARSVQRPCGRPPKPSAPAPRIAFQKVATETVRFLMDHPGSVVPGTRRTYTDGFRRFVVSQVRPGGPAETLTVAELAQAIDVSPRTLRDWLAQKTTVDGTLAVAFPPAYPPDTLASQPSNAIPDSSEPAETPPDEQRLPAEIVQILALWQRWRGGFSAFVTSLRQHRIYATAHNVRHILNDYAQRVPKLRGNRRSDAEAGRGSLETFHPNAQLFADGKQVSVTINGDRFTFCWQTLVDGKTTTPTGLAIRDAEDGHGLLEALQMSTSTTGAYPDAITRDGKPALYNPEVLATFEDNQILAMPTTPNRGQSKAPVEGLFGLFSQYLPPIELQAQTLKRLARDILWYVVVAYCVGRGRAPRAALGGRSPRQAFLQDHPTQQQRQQARQRLRDIRNRILDQQAAFRRRTDPLCRAMLEQTFADSGLKDPAGSIIPTIAHYGLHAVTEAIAIFRHKRDTKRLPDFHQERYLLGIARNVAHRNQHLDVYRETVRLRQEARDVLLQPLKIQAETLANTLPLVDYIDACLDKALDARFHIDRQFWADSSFAALETLPQPQRHQRGLVMARQIATQFRLPPRHREALLASLAPSTTPTLAA